MFAVVGIVLSSRARSAAGPVAGGVAASVVLGLLSAFGFGSFYVAMDAASEGGVPWALFVARLTAVVIFVVAASVIRSPLAVGRADFPVLALIGVLIVSADAMYAVASTLGLLGVVAVLSSLYPLVTIGLARLYLHERLARPQQLGIALCLCGAVALSAA
ncbi:MAG: EamA family transporter [Streptosporangiales bacterium]|nr:EamA family transporter [Streptosporangiales bacterium]